MKRRIGIYGGTFDPPHMGHRKAAESFLNSGSIDQLWIVPAMQAPAKGSHQATFDDRLNMCRLNFADLDNCLISDVERTLPVPNFTYLTLNKLSSDFTDETFMLCIGSDSFERLHTWKHAVELISLYKVLVVERPGSPTENPNLPKDAKVTIILHTPVPHSSTAIRTNFSANNDDNSLLPSVAEYIKQRNLY